METNQKLTYAVLIFDRKRRYYIKQDKIIARASCGEDCHGFNDIFFF